MSIKPPFTAVEVKRAASGFYEGHSVEIALLSKGIMVALVIWALVLVPGVTVFLIAFLVGPDTSNLAGDRMFRLGWMFL